MINRDTGRRIADGTIYNHKNALKELRILQGKRTKFHMADIQQEI